MQWVFLPSDAVMAAIAALLAAAVLWIRRSKPLRAKWRRVFSDRAAAASAALLAAFFAVALLDSVHYREALPPSGAPGAAQAYAPQVKSALDLFIRSGLGAAGEERSYSSPFAMKEWDRTSTVRDGRVVRDRQPLRHAGEAALGGRSPGLTFVKRSLIAAIAGGVSAALFWIAAGALLARRRGVGFAEGVALLKNRDGSFPWRPAMAVGTVLWMVGVWLALVWPLWHVMGTDAVGSDVLYEALKSIRTAFVIGVLATVSMLPFAIFFGMAAGYVRGWVDDLVQYLYTTISSVPSVLLIAASVLMATVFLDKHPEFFETSLERADLRLMMLACIIGVTGWSTLARLLRAETMKVASLDFVRSAKAQGVGSAGILMRHVLPNVLHIVLVVTVLDFSGIVLYEAVLSYVGVGVDPVMHSFGTMINAARSEMSRSPMIWWNLAASFLFLGVLVLSANLFASAVRDAFDPRSVRRGEGGQDV